MGWSRCYNAEKDAKMLRVVRNAEFEWIGSPSFVVCRAALTGLRRPQPVGMPMHACCSFLRSRSRSFLWAFFCWHSVHNFSCMRLCLPAGKAMQWLIPSKIHPRISLHMSHSLSPWHSFLRATGSSSVPLVTDGGVNMEWMP